MQRYTFSKAERLSSKKDIEELFAKGSSFHTYPIRVKFFHTDRKTDHSVLISVPKRSFKRAVDRNLLKRRIREAYRLNKSQLGKHNYSIHLALLYTGKEILDFNIIEKKLILCLQQIDSQLKPSDEEAS